jgi:aspartate racemase
MGPAATVDLFGKITDCTAALRDQDHLHVIIDSNAAIPDRTAAILGKGEDPLPSLVATALNLERAGAGILVMPCNTAHWYHTAIQAAVDLPVLHMIQETAAYIRSTYPGIQRVGLMATDGTLHTGLYDTAFAEARLSTLLPAPEYQTLLMRAIYEGVKAGRLIEAEAQASQVAQHLSAMGAQVVVLGCTELPIALRSAELPVPAVDPTYVLARAAVAAAGGPLADVRRFGT